MEIINEDIIEKKKRGAHPSQIRYMKNRYDTDEEYRNNQKINALKRYNNIREELMERYKNDEELKKIKAERNRIYYLKKKAEREEEKRRLKEEEERKLEELTAHLMDVS